MRVYHKTSHHLGLYIRHQPVAVSGRLKGQWSTWSDYFWPERYSMGAGYRYRKNWGAELT